MENNNNKSVVSIGFTGLLTLIFIVLKLCGVIAWSWWWVLSPLWIPVAIALVVVLLVFLGGIIADAIENRKSK